MRDLWQGWPNSILLATGFTTQFDFTCTVAVLIIGLVTCIAVRSHLRGATLPLAGLFLLAADSKLFWPQMSVLCIVERLGYIEVLRDRPWVGISYYAWHFLPIVLAGFFAWALWKELRRMPAGDEPACHFGQEPIP